VDLLLALLLGLLGGLVLGESAAQGTGVLGSEVEREELLVLVEQAELGALVEVDDGENASDRLANVVAVNSVSISSVCCVCICEFCDWDVESLSIPFPPLVCFASCDRVRDRGKNVKTGIGITRTFSGSSRRHRQRSSGHGAG